MITIIIITIITIRKHTLLTHESLFTVNTEVATMTGWEWYTYGEMDLDMPFP